MTTTHYSVAECDKNHMESGFTVKERKKNAELRELFGLERVSLLIKKRRLREPFGLERVSLLIKKRRLRLFIHMEHKDDTEWIKRCTTMEMEETKPTGRLRKTWWNAIIDGMKSFGLYVLVHWPLMGGLLHVVQRGGTGWGRSPPRPLLMYQM